MDSERYIVMYSGGIQAWHAAYRLVARGVTPTLLFADTRIEDEDLYRFLGESASALGCELVTVAAKHHRKGLDIWDEFIRKRWIGNSRIAPCSANLKQVPAREWVDKNCDLGSTVVVLGHDWSEMHRTVSASKGWAPWRVEFPNTEAPYVFKDEMLRACSDSGVAPPRLYADGAPHNNCGGFCVRAGKGHMAWLLKTNPERFWHHAQREQDARKAIGKDQTVLRDETLMEFGERIQRGGQVDMFDIGGCGCFTEEDDA